MKRGYFLLSHEILVKALHLPYNAEIIAVDFYRPNICKVWVEHPEIPNTLEIEGMSYPELHPSWKSQESVMFEGWGFDEE